MATRTPHRSRLIPATLLAVGVLVVCCAQMALGWISARRLESSLPQRVRAAQERFLAAFPVLVSAREELDLPDRDRAELRSNDVHQTGFIGLESSPLTSTAGSLRAKRLSTDPRWVARIASALHQCRDGRPDAAPVAWIGASGSFPALTIAAVLACEAEELTPLVISSLTASSWGANVPGFDFLHMERQLSDAGVIQARSIAASVGGEGDRGVGLHPEVVASLRRWIVESGVELIDASTLEAAAERRLRLWREATGATWPVALISVGGGAAVVGPPREALQLKPGLNQPTEPDAVSAVGVAQRALAGGVPVIHLLNIDRLVGAMPAATSHSEDPAWSLSLARRALALAGLISVGLWVGARLGPPVAGPLPNEISEKGAFPS